MSDVLTLPHRVVCAWCQREGVKNVVQEGVPPISHGICERHTRAMLDALETVRVERGLDVA